jgi:hypothetical protein
MRADASRGQGLLAYYGHHKCASKWITNVLRQICRDAGLTEQVVVDEATPHGMGPLTDYRAVFDRSEIRRRADEIGADFVMCQAADRQQAQILAPERAFHVIRDPRDIVVSAYFSHRNSHPVEGLPELQEHRERLRAVPQDEGLMLEFDFSEAELRQLAEWDYATPGVLEVRMEDLTADPYGGWVEIFRHLELLEESTPLRTAQLIGSWTRRVRNRVSKRDHLGWLRAPGTVSGELLLSTVFANRFEAKAGGRGVGTEDSSSHYRKGVAGDWRSHFTPEHHELFSERYAHLLVKLGYASSERAVQTASSAGD